MPLNDPYSSSCTYANKLPPRMLIYSLSSGIRLSGRISNSSADKCSAMCSSQLQTVSACLLLGAVQIVLSGFLKPFLWRLLLKIQHWEWRQWNWWGGWEIWELSQRFRLFFPTCRGKTHNSGKRHRWLLHFLSKWSNIWGQDPKLSNLPLDVEVPWSVNGQPSIFLTSDNRTSEFFY